MEYKKLTVTGHLLGDEQKLTVIGHLLGDEQAVSITLFRSPPLTQTHSILAVGISYEFVNKNSINETETLKPLLTPHVSSTRSVIPSNPALDS